MVIFWVENYTIFAYHFCLNSVFRNTSDYKQLWRSHLWRDLKLEWHSHSSSDIMSITFRSSLLKLSNSSFKHALFSHNFVLFFKTGSGGVFQPGLELVVLLPQSLKVYTTMHCFYQKKKKTFIFKCTGLICQQVCPYEGVISSGTGV